MAFKTLGFGHTSRKLPLEAPRRNAWAGCGAQARKGLDAWSRVELRLTTGEVLAQAGLAVHKMAVVVTGAGARQSLLDSGGIPWELS